MMVVCPLLARLILSFSSDFVPGIGSFRILHSCWRSFSDLSTIEVGLRSLSSLFFFTDGRGECTGVPMSLLGVGIDGVPPPWAGLITPGSCLFPVWSSGDVGGEGGSGGSSSLMLSCSPFPSPGVLLKTSSRVSSLWQASMSPPSSLVSLLFSVWGPSSSSGSKSGLLDTTPASAMVPSPPLPFPPPCSPSS